MVHSNKESVLDPNKNRLNKSPASSVKTVSENPESVAVMAKASQAVKKMRSDPFKSLGFGLNTYFETLASFIKLFAIFTVINMGVMLMYNSFDGMKSLSGVSRTASLSIGNLGFSSSHCSTVNYGVGNNIIGCPHGTVQHIYSFGIEPKKDALAEGMSVNFGKDKGPTCIGERSFVCQRFFDKELMNQTLRNDCYNKEICTLDHFERFVKPNANKNDPDFLRCTDDDASLFV